ncbi:hypothetical protein P0D88_45260 [Paraburkholderia sp. RL18-103-BIB-C]|uniref:hypothetical protein n=1 Tax=Paraburkholderia sp. RL18-103-BIB-C TaxID=3031637 RepID=UPI0038BAF0A0
MSNSPRKLVCALAVLGLISLTLVGCNESRSEQSQLEKVPLTAVPAPVKATIEQEAKAGALKEVEKTTVGGKTAYVAGIVVNGKEQQTLIGEDGKVIRRGAAEADDDD